MTDFNLPPLFDLTLTNDSGHDVALTNTSDDVELALTSEAESIALGVSLGGTGPSGADGSDGSIQGWMQVGDPSYDVDITGGVRTMIDFSSMSKQLARITPALENQVFFVNGRFAPVGDAVGEKYRIRLNLVANSVVINNTLKFELDIGGTQGVIETHVNRLVVDAGVDQLITNTFDFYAYGTFIANGGAIYVTSTTDCNLSDIVTVIVVELV